MAQRTSENVGVNMWKIVLREVLILVAVFVVFFLLVMYFTAWGGMMEQRPAASTIELSIIYPDSTIVPMTISSVVPDSVPREIILRVWKSGAVTTSHFRADSAGVTVARVLRVISK